MHYLPRQSFLCPLIRSALRQQSSYVQELAKKSRLVVNQQRQQVQQLEEELVQLKAEEAELVKAKEAEPLKVQGSAGAEPAPGTELYGRLAEVCRRSCLG